MLAWRCNLEAEGEAEEEGEARGEARGEAWGEARGEAWGEARGEARGEGVSPASVRGDAIHSAAPVRPPPPLPACSRGEGSLC